MEAWAGAPWTPRRWQAEALPLVLASLRARKRPLLPVVMGAGKSICQVEIANLSIRNLDGRAVVLSAPRQRLVKQLAGTTVERLGSERVGMFYADAKQSDRDVIICCNASLPALLEDLGDRKIVMLIIDEAHNSEAEQAREAILRAAPVCVCGFTATAFRSIPKESLSLFDEVVYRYTIEDAVRDGCLVPPRVVRYRGFDPGHLDAVCLDMIIEHGDGPGIVSARDIDDAEEYAGWLSNHGVSALAVHSRMSSAEQDERIERLRTEDVRCLVHVALLAEGVDFPWLRWICLRRHVQARVRFLQELGRVLRTHPGKTEGLILDPHLLLGRHGLESVEAIGAAMEQAALAEEKEGRAQGSDAERREHEVVALDMLSEHLSTLREELEANRVLGPRYASPDGDGWRLADVSEKQVAAIKKASRLTRHVPHPHKEAVKALVKVPWALTRGQASDLMDVLFGGSKWAREHAHGREPFMVQWPASRAKVNPPDQGSVRMVSRMKV